MEGGRAMPGQIASRLSLGVNYYWNWVQTLTVFLRHHTAHFEVQSERLVRWITEILEAAQVPPHFHYHFPSLFPSPVAVYFNLRQQREDREWFLITENFWRNAFAFWLYYSHTSPPSVRTQSLTNICLIITVCIQSSTINTFQFTLNPNSWKSRTQFCFNLNYVLVTFFYQISVDQNGLKAVFITHILGIVAVCFICLITDTLMSLVRSWMISW